MRLINSFISETKLQSDEAKLILHEYERVYSKKIEMQHYKYEDRKYYETDIDIIDIQFHKDSIYEEIDKLIQLNLGILKQIDTDADIITANDDTETAIQVYEKNRNDISKFGLFITKRKICIVTPYYSNGTYNVYLDFDYTSFGVMFDYEN